MGGSGLLRDFKFRVSALTRAAEPACPEVAGPPDTAGNGH